MGQVVVEKGDTKPNVKGVAKDFDGNAIDVSEAMLYFNMYDRKGNIVIENGGVNTPNSGTDGVVEYKWKDGDTDTVGTFKGEVVAEYSDGVLTIPNDGFIDIKIGEKEQ